MFKKIRARSLVSRILVVAACFASSAWSAADVPLARIGGASALRSDNVQLQALDSAKLKGKVVLVYYWTTKCAVCLEKMQELRSNAAGWKGKPFVIVAISRDEKKQDFEDYLAVARQLNVPSAQFVLAHAKDLAVDNLFRAGQLPLTFIIDTSGIIQHMHVGRIPPEAWDQVAELLP